MELDEHWVPEALLEVNVWMGSDGDGGDVVATGKPGDDDLGSFVILLPDAGNIKLTTTIR